MEGSGQAISDSDDWLQQATMTVDIQAMISNSEGWRTFVVRWRVESLWQTHGEKHQRTETLLNVSCLKVTAGR